MQAINISSEPVSLPIARHVAETTPQGRDIVVARYEQVTFEPGEIREMRGYGKPRKPLSTVEMLSNGRIVPITDERAQNYLKRKGRASEGLAVSEDGDRHTEDSPKPAWAEALEFQLQRVQARNELLERQLGELDAVGAAASSEAAEEPPAPPPTATQPSAALRKPDNPQRGGKPAKR